MYGVDNSTGGAVGTVHWWGTASAATNTRTLLAGTATPTWDGGWNAAIERIGELTKKIVGAFEEARALRAAWTRAALAVWRLVLRAKRLPPSGAAPPLPARWGRVAALSEAWRVMRC